MNRLNLSRPLLAGSLAVVCAALAWAQEPAAGVKPDGVNIPVRMTFEGSCDNNGAPLTNTGSMTTVTAKETGGYRNYVSGKFGSTAYNNKINAIVVNNGGKSLGCSSASGFSVSFFLTSESTPAWTNMLSFNVGAVAYRVEINGNNGYVLYSDGKGASMGTSFGTPIAISTGKWKHLGITYTPPAPEGGTGSLKLYGDGKLALTYNVTLDGALTELCIGGARRGSTTGSIKRGVVCYLDDVALFDAPLNEENMTWLSQNSVADIDLARSLTLAAGEVRTEHVADGSAVLLKQVTGPAAGEAQATLVKTGKGLLTISGDHAGKETANTLIHLKEGNLRLDLSGGWGVNKFGLKTEVGTYARLPDKDVWCPSSMDIAGTAESQVWFVDLTSVGTLYLRGGTLLSASTSAVQYTCVCLPQKVEATGDSTLSGFINLPGGTTFTIAEGGTLTADGLCNGPSGAASTLTKAGPGAMTLKEAAYTGTTTVTEGSLQITGSYKGGDMSVAQGASLAVGGTIAKNMTLAEGATLDLSQGPLTLNGTLTVQGTATIRLPETCNELVNQLTLSQVVGKEYLSWQAPTGTRACWKGTTLQFFDDAHAPTVEVLHDHAWLTRGAGQEGVIALRPDVAGAFGGTAITVRPTNCTAADFASFRVYRMPSVKGGYVQQWLGSLYAKDSNASAIGAERLAEGTVGEAASDGSFTVTFPASEKALQSGDMLWLTVEPKTSIAPMASFTVAFSQDLKVGDYVWTPAQLKDAAVDKPHTVFPYRDRVAAYTKAGCLDFWKESTERRLKHLTDIYVIEGISVAADYTLQANETARAMIKQLKTWRKQYHPNLRIKIVSAGNPNHEKNPLIRDTMSETHRTGFVNSVEALMTELGVDGIDFDWEYCHTQQQKQDFAILMCNVKSRCFAHGWELSAAVSTTWRDVVLPAGALAAMDYINIMAYDGDLNSPYTLMQGSYEAAKKLGVHVRRIHMGQAMYNNDKATWQQSGWASMVKTLGQSDGYTGYDCDASKRDFGGDKGKILQTYTGPTTYRGKVRACLDWNLGGVFSWGYYTDVAWDSPHSLARHQAQVVWPRTAWDFAEPATDETGAYLLNSEDDWHWFTHHADTVVSAKLTADIMLAHDPHVIPSFSGTLDGQGHTLTLPEQTWIVSYDDAGLFIRLNGTVRNLTVDCAGRIISRSDRKYDVGQGVGNSLKLTANGTAQKGGSAAVIAVAVGSGCKLENVRVLLQESAEVRGQHQAAGLAAGVWTWNGAVTLSDCMVDAAGKIRTAGSDSLEYPVTMGKDTAGICGLLTGQINWGGETPTVDVKCCTAVLRPTAVVASEQGHYRSAAGAIGSIQGGFKNNRLTLRNVNTEWYEGAQVKADGANARSCQPWIATHTYWDNPPAPTLGVHGRIRVYGTYPWATGTPALWVTNPSAPEADTAVSLPVADESGVTVAPAITAAVVKSGALKTLKPGTTVAFAKKDDANRFYVFGNLEVNPSKPDAQGRVVLSVPQVVFGFTDMKPTQDRKQLVIKFTAQRTDAVSVTAEAEPSVAFAKETRLVLVKTAADGKVTEEVVTYQANADDTVRTVTVPFEANMRYSVRASRQ